MASTVPAAAVSVDVATGFKGAMRRLASGVAIVVARGEGVPVGMAATSITSLTMVPAGSAGLCQSVGGHSSLSVAGLSDQYQPPFQAVAGVCGFWRCRGP